MESPYDWETFIPTTSSLLYPTLLDHQIEGDSNLGSLIDSNCNESSRNLFPFKDLTTKKENSMYVPYNLEKLIKR